MSVRKIWTREETILAFDLYCRTPFGRIHAKNPEIIHLASLIERTPSSVTLKLANFASLDTSIEQKGASHSSKLDSVIYNEFSNNLEMLNTESSKLLTKYSDNTAREIPQEYLTDLPYEGMDREAIVKARVNQNFFRQAVLAAYDNKCCITGLSIPALLVASHIVPWSIDQQNRVNPRNGLCLNALHDKAFDTGLLTITTNLKVKLSPVLKDMPNDSGYKLFLQNYENKPIQLPTRFLPDPNFLEHHNRVIFKHNGY